MRAGTLSTSLVPFLDCLSCEVEKTANEHGHARIKGHIAEEEKEAFLKRLRQEVVWGNIVMTAEEEGKEELFSGVLEAASLTLEGTLYTAELEFTGGTCLLEGRKQTKTIQNKTLPYRTLFHELGREEKAQFILQEGKESELGSFQVQYQETNWDFIKRMASHLNLPILPYQKGTRVCYYVGLPLALPEKSVEVIKQHCCYEKEEYSRKKRSIPEVRPEDFICYHITTRDFLDLGAKTVVEGEPYYVYQAKSCWVQGELLHTYEVRREGGFLQETISQPHLIGASLLGEVLAVEGSLVKLQIIGEEPPELETANWFPYATPYSSPDGSGWYCMPSKGDRVRLTFPTNNPKDAYVINSVHLEEMEGERGACRTNPRHTSFMNPEKKQILMTPTRIQLTNHQGMSVTLDDEAGIFLQSDTNIVLQAKGAITIQSEEDTLSFQAQDAIELLQGDTKITMQEDVVVEGAVVKMK